MLKNQIAEEAKVREQEDDEVVETLTAYTKRLQSSLHIINRWVVVVEGWLMLHFRAPLVFALSCLWFRVVEMDELARTEGH